jgi:hypothetical protein
MLSPKDKKTCLRRDSKLREEGIIASFSARMRIISAGGKEIVRQDDAPKWMSAMIGRLLRILPKPPSRINNARQTLPQRYNGTVALRNA